MLKSSCSCWMDHFAAAMYLYMCVYVCVYTYIHSYFPLELLQPIFLWVYSTTEVVSLTLLSWLAEVEPTLQAGSCRYILVTGNHLLSCHVSQASPQNSYSIWDTARTVACNSSCGFDSWKLQLGRSEASEASDKKIEFSDRCSALVWSLLPASFPCISFYHITREAGVE